MVNGLGAELSDTERLKNRAKRKTITQSLVLSLIKAAETRGDTVFVKRLWNTFHCQSRIRSANGRLYGNYCKNRCCLLCLGIRKADIINEYLPILKRWEEPYFVTLTVKAQPAKNLNKWIEKGMVLGFPRIVNRYKMKCKRGTGILLTGVRSLECNFNPMRRTYNPHFHLIVPNKSIADTLVKEWLQLWGKNHANRLVQLAVRINDPEKALIEIVKYGSKIFTEPDVKQKERGKSNPYLYAKALYNILNAMDGHRLFERFGFNKPNGRNRPTTSPHFVSEYEEWLFDLELSDWENAASKPLSDYQPTNELIVLITEKVNLEIE